MSSDRCETAPREEEGEGDGEEGDEVEGYGGFGGGGGVAGGVRVRCAAGDGENEAEGDEELDEAEGFEGEEGVWGGGGVGCVDAGGWSVPGLEVYYWRPLIGWLRWVGCVTYRRESRPRVASRRGERPTDSRMRAVLIRLGSEFV